jgi:hypothetical protein
MNNVPPIIPTSNSPENPSNPPLGNNPEEQLPISGIASAIEAILRQPRRVLYQLRQASHGNLIAGLLIIAFVCSLVYGLVVGTFSGHEQLWAAPAKIAAGLLISALICLPSLYIFSCLSGSEARLSEVCGLVAGLLALMTILLIGFAPVAWIFSQSTESITAMSALHLIFWFIATAFGLRFLHAGFSHLRAKTKGGFRVWTIIFLLVMLQMTAALRPLIGTAPTLLPTEKKFFLSYWADCLQNQSRHTPGNENSR